jgi:hypothetical protein
MTACHIHNSTAFGMGRAAEISNLNGSEAFLAEVEGQVKQRQHTRRSDETNRVNLASTCQNQGRWNEAEELEVQVIEKEREYWAQRILLH